MANAAHCFSLLLENKFPSAEVPPVVAAYGDEGFLRQETTRSILAHAKVEPDEVKNFDGEECKWIDVHDELATMSLFGMDSRRVAVVANADKLVKDARPQLEKWVESAPASSLLVLQIQTFPSNTKLFKSVAQSGWSITCSATSSGKGAPAVDIVKWIQGWAKVRVDLKLTQAQCRLVLDAVGPDCGLLHQELSKLALYAEPDGKMSDEVILANVGSWQTRTMWEIADAIADGRIVDALDQLQKVFAAGEHPAAVIPQISWSLRRYGMAAQLVLQSRRTGNPMSTQAAVGQVGFRPNECVKAETRLKRMGVRRAPKLLEWLLELDLKIKGSHSHEARAVFALEELCLRFADLPRA